MKVLIATAMYPTPQNPAFGSFIKTQVEALKDANVDIDLFILQGSNRKLMYPKAVLQLNQRLAADPAIDLIHAHYSFVGMVARLQWKVPVVVTNHGDDLLGTILNDSGAHTPASKYIVVAGQLLSKVVDASIVQSREMAMKLDGSKNVNILPHEVDLDLFRPIDKFQARAELGLDPKRKYLLFAANPDTMVKRFSLAKAVADQMAQDDPSIELIVVYKEVQERLVLFMNACDVLIFPSFQEGSPNIIKQSMACNMPIVATDVGDVREQIGSTAGCYICRPDVSEFMDKISLSLSDGRRTNGRDQIQHFDRAAVTKELIAVYESVIKQ